MRPSILFAVLLGAACAPALAITNAVAPGAARTPVGPVQQGVIEQAGLDTVRISERSYTLSPSTTSVYDRHGKRIGASRLVVGKTVRFTVSAQGTQPRIHELWLTD